MQHKLPSYLKKPNTEKRLVLIIGIIIAIVLVTLLVAKLSAPHRSVAAYCSVHKQETIKLGHAGGSAYTYSSALFPDASSNNPATFIPSFNRLDAVAPKDIEPQVKAMRDIFQKMSDNPTETLSAAVNGLPVEQAVTQWTQQHCTS